MHCGRDSATFVDRMRGLAFEKYEGLGNDFLVVLADTLVGLGVGVTPSLEAVRVLCDRRRGVGGDGVLVVGSAPLVVGGDGGDAGGAIATMKVHNADGSVPEMCGNGLRCVALSLVRRGIARAGEPFVVATDAGPRRCVVSGVGDDGSVSEEATVEVEMGRARSTGTVEVTVGRRKPRWLELDSVSTGNPHAVYFGEMSAEEVDRLGAEVSTHEVFPGGVNAGFARITEPTAERPKRGIELVVWERGVGKTLACGTGACAAAFAACVRGALPYEEQIAVQLPGGELAVTVARDGHVRMRGPARLVFRGEAT